MLATVEFEISDDDLLPIYNAMTAMEPKITYPVIWNHLETALERLKRKLPPHTFRVAKPHAESFCEFLERQAASRRQSSALEQQTSAEPFERAARSVRAALEGC